MKEGWTYKKLGECLSYIKNGANIKQAKGAAGIPITRIETLSGGVFNRDRLGYADIFSTENYIQYIMDDGDILMSHINSKAYIGRSVLYRKNGDEVIIHGMNLLRLKVIPTIITPTFINTYFKSNKFKDNVARIRKDAVNQSSMAITDLKRIPIPIPPMAEQERIVAELDLLQGIIEKKKEQLKAYDQLTQSIFYTMFGDPIDNPKGWEMSCFGNIMTPAKSNKCKSHSELPILSITMHDGIVRQNERFKKVIASKDVTGYKIIKRGQLVIAFPIDEGLIYTQDIEDEGIMSPAYNVWDVDYKKVQTLFLKFHLHSAVIMKYYKDKLRGTTLRRRMIPKEDLLNLPIPLPPISQQEEFAEKVEAIERQKALVQQSIDETQTMFDFTMDKYFG